MFSKRNAVLPFEDHKPLEFFSQKNDAALIVFASHSKKRPHNLVFARMFEYQLLDMFELGIESYTALKDFKTNAMVGNRPLMIFNGDSWEDSTDTITIRSLLLDMFTGDPYSDRVDLRGLTHLISFTLEEKNDEHRIMMRVYNVLLKKSGGKIPKVELEESGPSINFIKRRCINANMDMLKDALREPMVNRVIFFLFRRRNKRMLLEMSAVKRLVVSMLKLKIYPSSRLEK
jgi:ribosome production factor 2